MSTRAETNCTATLQASSAVAVTASQRHPFRKQSHRWRRGTLSAGDTRLIHQVRDARCGANNAPEGTAEYDTECWRCGDPLGGKPEVGDEVTVDIVDRQSDGTLVCKTESGFVLFLEADIAAIEATVRVTTVEETHGEADLVETGA